ncbi:MAG: hypothetical protein DRI34_14805, partial [Deltaproteobacteria bacterium]
MLLVPALLLSGCGDRREAHLERFLQPGDGGQAAGEQLDVFSLPGDAAVADKINTRPFREVAARLGAHSYRASVHFSMSSPQGWVSLDETDHIVYARNGDFSVNLENDAGQGYQAIYSGGKFFLRNRHALFHPRGTIDGQHWRRLQEAYGGWASIYRLFRGRLGFVKGKLVNHHGRDAVEFTIGLNGGKPRLPGTTEPPPVPAGVKKYVYPIEPTPSYRDRWRDRARPVKARGRLLVDADAGAVLAIDFQGKLLIPANQDKPEFTVAV